jgi:hypothetical protein
MGGKFRDPPFASAVPMDLLADERVLPGVYPMPIAPVRCTQRRSSMPSHRTFHNRGQSMKDQAPTTNTLLATLSVLFLFLTTSTFASQFTVLHNFQEHPAAYPASGLIADSAGNLYGTTAIQGDCPPLCGEVFQLERTSSGWLYHIVHKFHGPQGDGELPFGQLLLDSAGNLYGTTFSNGSSETCIAQHADCGTVFELSRSAKGGWAEKVLYRFKGKADGAFPQGNLFLDSAGNLFGTTLGGGSFNGSNCQLFGCGVIFELSPGVNGWKESVLYSFTGGGDGWRPEWLTPDSDGNFLGVAELGGSSGTGTVFKLTQQAGAWTLSVIYSFTGGSDGAYPSSQLIFDPQGNLYGTAGGGGIAGCGGSGCGTVFELSPNGSGWDFTDIYSFSGTDGGFPHGILFDSTGNMFGVAYGGIAKCPAVGCGVLFKLVPSTGDWTETVLHKFSGGLDGGLPHPVILDGAGNLFGAAGEGGTRNFGTIFEFTP